MLFRLKGTLYTDMPYDIIIALFIKRTIIGGRINVLFNFYSFVFEAKP